MNNEIQRNQNGRAIIKRVETKDVYIPIPVLDERFLMQDFTYAVDINFTDLPKAANAQDYVLQVFDNIVNSIAFDETLIDSTVQTEYVDAFLIDIANLINDDEDNLASRKLKINKLEEEIQTLIQDNSVRNDEIYRQMADLENAQIEINQKDEQIEELRETVNELINQIDNTNG